MRATVDRTVSAQIPAPPEQVRAFYIDLGNLALVHPLIESVTRISETTYRIKDRIPLGFLTIPVSYTAIMRVPHEGPVSAEAIQFPGVRLRSTVTFDACEGGTELVERLAITAPRPLLGFTVRRAVAAHTEMLAGIRRAFAG